MPYIPASNSNVFLRNEQVDTCVGTGPRWSEEHQTTAQISGSNRGHPGTLLPAPLLWLIHPDQLQWRHKNVKASQITNNSLDFS